MYVPEPHEKELDEMFAEAVAMPQEEVEKGTPMIWVHSVPLSAASLIMLRPYKWLTGDVIYCYLKTVAPETAEVVSTFATECLFAGQDTEKAVEKAARVSRRLIKEIKDNLRITIVFPMALPGHWTLAIYYRFTGEIMYIDSTKDVITASGAKATERLRAFVEYTKLSLTSKETYVTYPKVADSSRYPTQYNDYDCGVFVCEYAKLILRNEDCSFREEDCVEIRRSILYSLYRENASSLLNEEEDEAFQKEETETVEVLVEELEELAVGPETPQRAEQKPDKPVEPERVASQLANLAVEPRPKYMGDDEKLEKLRKGQEPFVDFDADKKPFTANANGDWKRMLTLKEVLEALSANTQEAWEILALILRHDPVIAVRWMVKVNSDTSVAAHPQNFRFGNFTNYKRVCRIMNRESPGHLLVNPHSNVQRKKPRNNRGRWNPY